MGKSIPISRRHGVNPSMTVCMYCGESKGIALMGRLKHDQKAPERVLVDYEPCDKCKADWAKGVPIIEVTSEPTHKGQPPISQGQNVYPTGRYMVMNPEAMDEGYVVGQPTICMKEDYEKILGMALKAKEGAENVDETDVRKSDSQE